MPQLQFPSRFIARITIEFLTPFHSGSGTEGDVADAAVVLDVNGLPAIPGTTLAGILRHAFEQPSTMATAKALFGFQERGHVHKSNGQGSRLSFSWASIHDATNTPVYGYHPSLPSDDMVLARAQSPTLRDHVRITHRGVAAQHGKFDELCIAAGNRFTFEMELVGSNDDNETWNQLLHLWHHPALRIGAKTRRGFGAFKVVQILSASFDLTTKEGFSQYTTLPRSLAEPAPSLTPFKNGNNHASLPNTYATIVLRLEPRSYWMFGGGEDPEGTDMAPVTDFRIIWHNNSAAIQDDLIYIPGSALKGALAHRVCFHANKYLENFADKVSDLDAVTGSNNPVVRELFGFMKGNANSKEGARGRIIINDTFLKPRNDFQRQIVHHVSIDRFTGGARAGALFNEHPLYRHPDGGFDLTIYIENPAALSPIAKKALRDTLNDLCEARLPIGGGTGRGLGFCNGSIIQGMDIFNVENSNAH